MKTKRFISTLLALLLVCSLPVSAFADTVADNPAGTTVPEIPAGDMMYSNSGTVTNNDGAVNYNHGILTNNNNFVRENYGTVTNNYGEVNENYGTVTTNGTLPESETAAFDANAIVHFNYGTVTTNNGTVESNNNIVTNNGTENVNANVSNNYGTVTNNYGTVSVNYKTVETNNGNVLNALTGSTINTNNDYVQRNMIGSEIITNNGTVYKNGGTVGTNNGTVNYNGGTVETNSITGTVKNEDDGKVGTNYGTVKEENGTTWYGVQVDNDGKTTLEQKKAGEVLDLTQFTKEGYELTGYTRYYQMGKNGVEELPSPITESDTSYTVTCPNVLTLIWQAIVNPGSGSGFGENASAAGETAADNGTGSFGPGSFVSINGHKFLLVAVVEDVYCLASVDSFGEEQLSDLPALLSSLLTEEQLTHVTGEPELLDEELTARFFGGEGSHIVFPCDSGLIFS